VNASCEPCAACGQVLQRNEFGTAILGLIFVLSVLRSSGLSSMPRKLKYSRVLVKISGEALCGTGRSGIDAEALALVAREIATVAKMGAGIGLVVGGGNLIRGRDFTSTSGGPVLRVTADHMGMLATVINALALQDALLSLAAVKEPSPKNPLDDIDDHFARNVPVSVMSALPIPGLCEPFNHRLALRRLENKEVVIFAGGTGNPMFTTDTCAALRAGEVGAQVVMKATKVDGVYDSDPMTNPKAHKYEHLTFKKVLDDELGVMDLTAISLCMENKIPIMVFRLSDRDSLARAIRGENVGTLISE
jgi:uridylate kinase